LRERLGSIDEKGKEREGRKRGVAKCGSEGGEREGYISGLVMAK